MRVAIVSCGGSSGAFLIESLSTAETEPDRFDQIWAINHMVLWLKHDLGFIIDDTSLVEGVCPVLLNYMKTTTTPYYSSLPDGHYPSNRAFPIDEVVTDLRDDLFNNVGCYAIGYAISIGVESMTLYGMDYFWENYGSYERGGQAVSYLVGLARGRGIEVNVTMPSPLLDTNTVRVIDGKPRRRLYGYKEQPAMGHLPPSLGIEGAPL